MLYIILILHVCAKFRFSLSFVALNLIRIVQVRNQTCGYFTPWLQISHPFDIDN